jgi:Carboxypeptidase regulatory-like domain
MQLKRNIAVLFCCLLVFAGVGICQNVTATIAGTVTDNSGAVVPNAKVTVTNTDQNAVIKTVNTDASGNFAATYLPLGHYSVSIEAPNFQTHTEKGIELHVSDRYTLNAKLGVGTTAEQVTVEAGAIQVETQSATAAGLISGTQVRELALNGRNWEQLVTLSPGVSDAGNSDQIYVGSLAPQGTNLVTFAINGGRREENNFMIDGADNIDRGSNLTLLAFPSVDAIQEFKVIRGQYDPEYGRAASGQVNLVTRSGTSSLHGSIYEFFRNDALNANPYFNKRSQILNGQPNKPLLLRYNDFGGVIGGPVYIPKIYEQTNKTFFFFSEEARRNVAYTNTHPEVPTAAMRNGQFLHPVCVSFAADNSCTGTASSIPTTSFDPVSAAYIKDIFSKYPQPNDPKDPLGYFATLRGIFNFREEIYKIDHIFSPKLSVNGKILRDNIPTREPGGLFTGVGIDNIGSTNTNSPGKNYTFRGTLTLSPTLLIEPGYAYSYGAILSDSVSLLNFSASPDIASAINGKLPFSTVLGRAPRLAFSGEGVSPSLTGPSTFGPYRDFNQNHTGFTNVTKVVGSHTIKVGGTYYHYRKHENAGRGNEGSFTFSNNGVPSGTSNFEQAWANFLLGRVGTFAQSSLDLTADIRDNQFEYYAQDAWRVKPNLTISYGFRHSLFRQPTDALGLLENFDPASYDPAKAPCITSSGAADVSRNASGQLVSACNPSYDPLNGYIFAKPPAGFESHKSRFGSKIAPENNLAIAPRIGIAWDPRGDGKMSIRTGYGIFFDSGAIFGNAENNVFNGIGFQNNLSFTNVTIQNLTGGAVVPAVGLSGSVTRAQSRIDINYKPPYTQQWSLDLQRTLGQGWLMDVGYYGNNGVHLPGFYDINQPAENAFRKCTAATPCKSGANNISFGAVPVVNSGNTALLNALRPFVGYVGADAVRNIYSSNYHGLQTQLQKQFSGNSLISLAYTWSHSLTTYQADRTTGNIMPLQAHIRDSNYGPGVGDRRHVFTGNFVWALPWLRNQPGFVGHVLGGWEFSGIQTFQTGLPGTVSSNQAIDPTGAGCISPSPCTFRANQIGDPNANAAHNFDTGWFNASAFSNPVAGQTTIPSERPGAVRLPGFWRTDLGLFKNLKFTEKIGGQFRAEAFNAFNHTNPICCSSFTTSNTSFNKVVSTRDPRIMQLALKVSF